MVVRGRVFLGVLILLLACMFLVAYVKFYHNASGRSHHGNNTFGDEMAIRSVIYNELKAEASDVSLRYPSRPKHLWIKQDHGKILIRRVAFYDARAHFDESLVLIIILRQGTKPSFYIKIFHHDDLMSQPCQQLQYWQEMKGYWHNSADPIVYTHYLMRVPVDGRKLLPFVAISRDDSCTDLSSTIPIYNDTINAKTGVFSVCTEKGLFGNVDPQWLMHWIEFNLALGATYITILIQSVKSELYDAIRPYQEEGLVEIIEWNIDEDLVNHMMDKGIASSAQECIYRNVNRAEYLNLHDSDEILAPQKHTSWNEMMNDLKSVTDISEYASFIFPNEYWYDVGYPIKSAEAMMCPGNTVMKLPRYFMRTERAITPEYDHPKAMLHIESSISYGVHLITGWIDGKKKEFKVPPNIGQSFHFRVPLREEDYINFDLTYNPEFMLPYVKPIMKNLRKRFGC